MPVIPKKKPIVIKLSAENEKNIGYKIVNVGPGQKETVVRQNNFVINKKR
tara:strand:- start:567 stop:716 length:150 start_codon:yes stop_codon:yes gene_type:complete